MSKYTTLEEHEFWVTEDIGIKVSRVTDGQNDRIDIRQQYVNEDGVLAPTKKGVSIPVSHSEASAKVILLKALEVAGVSEKDILDHYDFIRVMGGEQ